MDISQNKGNDFYLVERTKQTNKSPSINKRKLVPLSSLLFFILLCLFRKFKTIVEAMMVWNASWERILVSFHFAWFSFKTSVSNGIGSLLKSNRKLST